jgi:membrane protease YdiL (CAAX protease family)
LVGDLGTTGIGIYPLGEVVFALILFAVLWRTGLLRQAGFRAPVRLRSMWWGIPFLLLAGLTLAGAQDLDTSLAMVAGLALLVIGGSTTEEIIFRGTLWEGLSDLGPWARSIATSLAFGSIHLLGIASGIPATVIMAQAVFAFGMGLILAGVRLSAGSCWTVVLLHIVFNFPALWANGGIEGTFTPGVELQMATMGLLLAAWGCFVIYRQVRASASERGHGGASHAEPLNAAPV